MVKKYTVLALSLLVASQASSMSWLNRTFRPEYSDLSDTLERCPVGEKKCLDYFAKYKKEINDTDYIGHLRHLDRKTDLGTHFAEATQTRSLPEIKRLVELGADVNKRPENSYSADTPIWAVVKRFLYTELGTDKENSTNAPEMIKFLVSKGADINAGIDKDSPGYTPLRLSLNYTGLKMTKWLIENGADVNKECYGDVPLMRADLDQAELLIKAGADVNHVGSYRGETPLFRAVNCGHVEKAALFVKHGANINAPYKTDSRLKCNKIATPLSKAMDNKDLAMLSVLGVSLRKPSQMTEFTGPNFIDN